MRLGVACRGGLLAAAVVATVALTSASCVAIFGVDELRYATGGGGDGGAGHGGSSGGTATGGAAAGGGGCASPDCATCRQSNCALQACSKVSEACLASDACQMLAQCIGDCTVTDGDCVADCLKAYPAEVKRYYAGFDCTSCGSQTCAAQCQSECQGCSMQQGGQIDCQSCINDACSLGRCTNRVQGCSSGSACATYMQCLSACNDQACASQCGAQSPAGLAAYLDLLLCVYCAPATCRATCAAEQSVDCSVLAAGQWGMEICDNGVDDDGDAQIDCGDPDCTGSTGCP